MVSMIEDLTRYGDAESGHLDATRVDLAALVADIASDVPEATVTVGPLFPIRADETAIRRVFVNLITNAVKYARPGVDPVVQVRGHADASSWVIELEDNGRGIPAEQLEAVFDPYRRLEAANSAITGSGLGLAVCRRLVERHGGTISARSDAEIGTTFTITLPRVAPPSAQQQGSGVIDRGSGMQAG